MIDKPQGLTSFDVVRRVRGRLGVKRVGHTGTLDPIATGVLPICLGAATKVAGLLAEGDKTYEAVIRLGAETDTFDAAGKVVAQAPVPPLDAAVIESALNQFRGQILQKPPMFSAVKKAGKRLYQLAREGREVERAPRPVTVYQLVLRDFTALEFHILVKCSKGFYVRALAHELGRALGCGGHLQSLCRTAAGPFTLAQSWSLNHFENGCPPDEPTSSELTKHLIAVSDALSGLAELRLSEMEAVRLRHGQRLELAIPPETWARLVGPQGQLLAVARREKDGRIRCRLL